MLCCTFFNMSAACAVTTGRGDTCHCCTNTAGGMFATLERFRRLKEQARYFQAAMSTNEFDGLHVCADAKGLPLQTQKRQFNSVGVKIHQQSYSTTKSVGNDNLGAMSLPSCTKIDDCNVFLLFVQRSVAAMSYQSLVWRSMSEISY